MHCDLGDGNFERFFLFVNSTLNLKKDLNFFPFCADYASIHTRYPHYNFTQRPAIHDGPWGAHCKKAPL